MSPDEVIERLKELGVEMSRPTLSRYEKQGLIPKAKRGSLGRAGGRFSEYPPETVPEAFAAWSLLHGKYFSSFCGGSTPKISPQVVKDIREAIQEKNLTDSIVCDDNSHEISEEQREFADKLFENERILRSNMSERDKFYEKYHLLFSMANMKIRLLYQEIWEAEVYRAKLMLAEKGLI